MNTVSGGSVSVGEQKLVAIAVGSGSFGGSWLFSTKEEMVGEVSSLYVVIGSSEELRFFTTHVVLFVFRD